jgi:hypothetical protein
VTSFLSAKANDLPRCLTNSLRDAAHPTRPHLLWCSRTIIPRDGTRGRSRFSEENGTAGYPATLAIRFTASSIRDRDVPRFSRANPRAGAPKSRARTQAHSTLLEEVFRGIVPEARPPDPRPIPIGVERSLRRRHQVPSSVSVRSRDTVTNSERDLIDDHPRKGKTHLRVRGWQDIARTHRPLGAAPLAKRSRDR